MDARYRTRIEDHIRMASSRLLANGQEPMSMRKLAAATKIPYNTVRRYVNKAQCSPNYAVIDTIRRYLNQFYEMPEEGYVYREDEELGQPAAVA